ncbi:Sphingolipid long chain base-responsive protein [Venturia inaequalis]|nr:Sphingolipid long chain base-responsive protein [Venturia inaequalis]
MDFKRKPPQHAEKTKKRERPRDENQREDVDMPDRLELDSRKIAQPSSRMVSKTRSASEDEDIDMDRRQRESAPAPEANEDVAMNRRKREFAPAPGARDSMSPARIAKKPPAPLRLERRASVVPEFTLPPGTKLFTIPSLFTGTHAVKNCVGGIDLPIRNASSRRADASFANGNANGSGDKKSSAPTPSPPPRHANLSATQQQPTNLPYNWNHFHFATEMLLSKQDAGAMGFDWSFSEFQQQYHYVHKLPGAPSGYMFSPDQKQQMAEMLRRQKVGAQGPQSSPPILGADLNAIIAGLPSRATPPSVHDENQPDPPVESGPRDDSSDEDLERALKMSLEDDENEPDPSVESDPQDDSYEADLKRAMEMSLEGQENQPGPSNESDSRQTVSTFGSSPPLESPFSHLTNQASAQPPTPPLGSQFTPINGRRQRKSSSSSDADQSVPSIKPAGPQRSIKNSGATLVNRPTRSFGRREERAGTRAEEGSDSAAGNTQRLTVHPTYECCCPHCGFFGESYTKFKRHLAEHFVKEGWKEYRCPMKGCDQVFAKTQLTQYMKYLEEQGLIQPKDRGVRDSLLLCYHQFRYHVKEAQKMRRKHKTMKGESRKVRKMKCRIEEEAEGSVVELTDDEEVVLGHADDVEDDARVDGVTS